MIKLKRWTTWKFSAVLKEDGVALDLSGYTILFTIKHFTDTDATDGQAVYEDDVVIATGTPVLKQTFTITPGDSDIAPWLYMQGFRYITPDDVEHVSDVEFEVLATTTNKRTIDV